MILTKLNDDNLLQETKELAKRERKIQVDLLWHLLEIQRRKLFLGIGYSSLYDYVVKELGYGHGAAYRRIQAMRLLESVPEVAEKIEEGTINLSTASQVQNFIKSEKKNGGQVSFKQRSEIVQAITHKSAREVEKHLIELKPENVIRPEKVRYVTAEVVELKLMIPDSLKEKLDRLRFHFSHRNPDMTYLNLIEYLTDRAILKIDSKSSKEKFIKDNNFETFNESKDCEISAKELQAPILARVEEMYKGFANQSKMNSARPHIPAALRHEVWLRDGGVCAFLDPKTGRKCGGRYQLQVDHIHPWSLGGTHALENLQLLCAQHNRQKGNRTSNDAGHPYKH